MDISFDTYNIFYYVCEFKNITKTANFLYISQPAITKQIKNLEKNLGKKLINKVPNGIELTEDGIILYNEIKDSIEKLQQVKNTFKEKVDKYDIKIRIIAGHNTIKKLLLVALSELNKKHHNLKFELSTFPFAESMKKLRDGKADLIFLSMDELIEEYNNIVVNELKSFEDILAVRSDLRDNYPKIIKLININDYPIICKSNPSVARQNVEKILEKKGVQLVPTYELSNNWLIEEYVKLGLGVGLVTKEYLSRELADNVVSEIETDIRFPKRNIGYAYRRNSIVYPIIMEFIKELNKQLKK